MLTRRAATSDNFTSLHERHQWRDWVDVGKPAAGATSTNDGLRLRVPAPRPPTRRFVTPAPGPDGRDRAAAAGGPLGGPPQRHITITGPPTHSQQLVQVTGSGQRTHLCRDPHPPDVFFLVGNLAGDPGNDRGNAESWTPATGDARPPRQLSATTHKSAADLPGRFRTLNH